MATQLYNRCRPELFEGTMNDTDERCDIAVHLFYCGRIGITRSFGYMGYEKKERDHYIKKLVSRLTMPYGMYCLANGREVLFNREYQPIWSRYDGRIEQGAPNELVTGEGSQIWFYKEHPAPWNSDVVKKRCENILADFLQGSDVKHHKIED